MQNDKLKLLTLVNELRDAILRMPGEDAPGEPAPPAKPITKIVFESTSNAAQKDVPFTFAQVFAVGDFVPDLGLAGRLDSGDTLPLQVDVKALHADGSVRHAIVSGVLPTLFVAEKRELALVISPKVQRTVLVSTAPPAVSVRLSVGGVKYETSLGELLKSASIKEWLSGSIVDEAQVSAPVGGHPHLAARFGLRRYANGRTRVEVVIENDWAYEPGPQNFTYDVSIDIAGKQVFEQKAFVHYHHARRREVFWIGEAPAVNVRHAPAYLIGTRALPNYDQSVAISEKYLTNTYKRWTDSRAQRMGVGLAEPAMPTTGGRDDIGLNPGWAVAWLLSQDPRAAEFTLGTADLSGSWSSHYRDKNTGLPVSLIDYPYMSLLGRPPSDTYNRPIKRQEAFPEFGAALTRATPLNADTSHQPNLAYMPYLQTGEFYYLEELQFWTMWSAFRDNPHYRDFEKGLVKPEQVRGQAWTLRSIGEAAYITPDNHPLKQHFLQILNSNLDWFNDTYVNTPATSNALGIVTSGYAFAYDGGTGIAPWQDDFVTSVFGHLVELGFEKAEPVLRWKVKFATQRMVGDGACWIHGAMYSMKVRDDSKSPVYSTIAEAFAKSAEPKATAGLPCGGEEMAKKLKLKPGEMTGYSLSVAGYPSNTQPALAFAADSGGELGKKAWAKFMARSVKPDYGLGAQFAIVPRTM